MDSRLLNTYRAALLKLRDELQEALSHLEKTADPVAPDRAIGRLTRMDALQAQQMALEMKRRSETRTTKDAHCRLSRVDRRFLQHRGFPGPKE